MMIIVPPEDATHHSATLETLPAALHNICLIKQRVTGPLGVAGCAELARCEISARIKLAPELAPDSAGLDNQQALWSLTPRKVRRQPP